MTIIIEKNMMIECEGDILFDDYIEFKLSPKDMEKILLDPDFQKTDHELNHLLNDAFIVIDKFPQEHINGLNQDIKDRAVYWLQKLIEKFK